MTSPRAQRRHFRSLDTDHETAGTPPASPTVLRLTRQLWVALTSLTLVASGCAPRQPFYFFEDGDLSHYVGAIQKLEYPDGDQAPLDEAAGTVEPLTGRLLRIPEL